MPRTNSMREGEMKGLNQSKNVKSKIKNTIIINNPLEVIIRQVISEEMSRKYRNRYGLSSVKRVEENGKRLIQIEEKIKFRRNTGNMIRK